MITHFDPVRRRTIATVFAGLALLATLALGVVWPYRTYQTRAATAAALAMEKADLVKQMEEQALWETLAQTLGDELAQSETALEAFHRDQQYIRDLQQFSARTRLSLDNIKVREAPGRIEVSCRVTGAYGDLSALFYYIETHQRPIRIQQLDLQAERETLTAQLQLEFWRGVTRD